MPQEETELLALVLKYILFFILQILLELHSTLFYSCTMLLVAAF